MAGLTEFYCGWNEPSHASQFKWLEYTFKLLNSVEFQLLISSLSDISLGKDILLILLYVLYCEMQHNTVNPIPDCK